MLHDTIAAISTAIGEAAISVVRVSGPQALSVAQTVFQAAKPLTELKPRQAYLVNALDSDGGRLDQGLLLLFRAPASYTGEDVVEFHGHGGLLVTQKLLESLLAAGARSAEPGEFTQRAFLNGKMDLTQAEAVMDLIHAQSTLALKAAHEQLGGAIGKEAAALREELLPVLAHVEAYIDFPEEDISPDTGAALVAKMDLVLARTRRLIDTSEQGRILRHGARTVICGEPNVGKSSLLNLLLGFERAIVSPTAGTTRDTIEEIIQVHGIPLRLVDTAGLRASTDDIERVGIERTQRELERADLILEVVDGSLPPASSQRVALPPEVESRRILILNKADQGQHPGWKDGVALSCLDNTGVEALRDAIRAVIMSAGTLQADHPIAINARHKACFDRIAIQVQAARTALMDGAAPEYVALDLREALQSLGEVVGIVDVEQILDVIFSSFCIGK
ncbi:tRNA modification GTPase [Prosthecobacter fusiformis]|uniref:tRNA modification GTPase MnmE n=1 Tax=Prosthecobacter fusiformis TaxID=48464 RepID=A0A4R7RP15_9BACT|nr:tRNA uridine-5-carboxymethylaminomethyl(34) synthesis GTPase MnmE [Prosthecobacter fusiformis]TDU67220.1 tRNA modification GTPase [Prosthecobacter fusiformis]